MSCRYAFLGLPRGKGFTKVERIKCADDAIFLNCVQTELEKRIGCYFYNFTPEFYVDTIPAQQQQQVYRFLKVGLSNCPGYSYGIVKAPLSAIEKDDSCGCCDATVQVTLYRGCCVARYFTFEIEGTVSATTSSIVITGTGAERSVVVTVKDACGQQISRDVVVTASVTGAGNFISDFTRQGNGTYLASLNAVANGTLTVTADGVALTPVDFSV